MKITTTTRRAVSCMAVAAVATGFSLSAAPALATSDSGHATYPNGKTLTANDWIQSFSWSGCGNFQTSAVLNATAPWITDQTDFYQVGFGSLSVKGVNISSSQQNSHTLKWTNYRASGSYLSGSVCGGWGAVYVGADVTAEAYYYGNIRIASASV